MSRDELAELIWDEDACDWRQSGPNEVADALIAAGYLKPRNITTVEELDALPAGSVVLSDAYRYMVWGRTDCGWPVSFQRWSDGAWHRGARSTGTHPDNFLPATVLYEPEPTK